jgi:3-oxoacyl-[acyl-carrier-protein] synthase-3
MLNILGMGFAHPETRISNKFIEDLDIGTNEEWILTYIGIEERLSTLPADYIAKTRNEDPACAREAALMSPTDLAVEAATMALEKAGITPDEIGLLICNGATPEATVPAEAPRIAKRLGVTGMAYDLFTACPAFALHMDYLANFRDEKLPDYVLCVSTATLTQHVNYNERSDAAIWGDGASAWVVSSRKPGRLQMLASEFMADPLRCAAVVVDTNGHFHQDGRAVRDFSVRQTVRLIRKLEKDFKIDWSKDKFIGHQANKTMLMQITKNRKIPESSHWHNVTHIGNQAGAGAPAVLAMNWENLKPGEKVVIAVVGAGLSWGSILLEAV